MINEFFGKQGSKASSQVEEFEKRKKRKTKKEIRQLEERMLAPTKLPPAVTQSPTDRLRDLGVKIMLPNQEAMELFKRHFKILTYVENNVADISLLLAFLKELDEGRITYDAKTRTIRYR